MIAQEASQLLGTHSTSELKAVILVSLMRDNEEITEDVTLAEKTFGLGTCGLKGKTKRSKPLPMQSQATDVSRELLSLHEAVESSFYGLHVNGKSFVASICYETKHATEQ